MQLLPNLQTPLGEDVVLSNVDFTKCYVEFDIVECSVTGGRQRHALGTQFPYPVRSMVKRVNTIPNIWIFAPWQLPLAI